ncbi:MAG: ATP-binding protein [Pseudobdellovibrionaceae bacterium]
MSSALKLKPSQPSTPGLSAPVKNMKILVVDDEVSIAQGIQSILAPAANVIPIRRSSRQMDPAAGANPAPRSQFQVTVAHSAEQALSEIQRALQMGEPFAMGFFDVLLGEGMDGIQLVKKAQELDPKLCAVFVTAYQDRSVDSISEVLGAENLARWDYMNKPFTEGEIVQKARNMTEWRHLEEMRLWHESQLAEARDQLLETERANTVAVVGRSVAHEFGNLMMQIMGHADLALLKKDNARMKEALETILKASETATSILSRFKKVAIHGDAKTEHTLIHIAKPVDEAIELMGYQLKKHRVKIEKVEFQQALLEAHHHSVVQVLMNVFINAVHVMPEGGVIQLWVRKNSEKDIEIEVKDSGPGIPAEILPRVTEALFTTKGEKGSGLGLAICKEIIEVEHHGDFKIENHPQGGAVVKIRLPSRQV